MAMNFSKGSYTPKNPQKYVGVGKIIFRSSWENSFCTFCDTNPSILKWASEPMRVPYRDPLTGKQTVYVPDFFIQYVDKNNKIHTEIIEIKPQSQQILAKVGKNKNNQAMYIKNQAKWRAADIYCRRQGIVFRILNENDMFHNGKAK